MMTSNTTHTNHSVTFSCSEAGGYNFIYIAFIVTRTLIILPLSSLVLYLGLQRWRQQRSFDTTSHSDIFTYNMAAMELIGAVGVVGFTCGSLIGQPALERAGHYLLGLIYPGQLFFHVLTCVERYLAVVHPVTYMGLRQSGGARIRNISIACVWLLCCGWMVAIRISDLYYIIFLFSLLFTIVVVSFCSLRVLCVLIRPGPGEVGGARERVDQSKQRAFYTMMAITVVLWMWFSSVLVAYVVSSTVTLSVSDACVAVISANLFMFPSSLVLPLLFLHRAGKLGCLSVNFSLIGQNNVKSVVMSRV